MIVTEDEWAKWAFSPLTWEAFLVCDADTVDLMEAWNRLHGNLMKLDENSSIAYGIDRMKQFYKEEVVDKKMHKVTQSMKVAEKDIKGGKPKAAVKTLERAEKKNEKLVAMDKKRDVIIDKAKKGKC